LQTGCGLEADGCSSAYLSPYPSSLSQNDKRLSVRHTQQLTDDEIDARSLDDASRRAPPGHLSFADPIVASLLARAAPPNCVPHS